MLSMLSWSLEHLEPLEAHPQCIVSERRAQAVANSLGWPVLTLEASRAWPEPASGRPSKEQKDKERERERERKRESKRIEEREQRER